MLHKKWMNYILVTVLIGAFIWTIYSNLIQQKSSSHQPIAIGSHGIEIAEEDHSETTVLPELNEIEIESQDEEHVHEHDEESAIDSHSDYGHEGHTHEINTTEVIDVSNQAPQFITKTLDGETVQLSDFLGKKVIINFWTTWCPPCQEEVPELQKFYEESMNDEEVVLLGLNITNDDLGIDVIREFREYYGITYPILLDEKREITNSYEILTIPTTYIIDEKGNLDKQVVGPLTNDMLNELIDN